MTGVHTLTFICKESVSGDSLSFSLAYFELSDFADRTAAQTLINATEFSNSSGVQLIGTPYSYVGWFSNDNYVTYSQVNYLAQGASKGILLRYAKNNIAGGTVEVRLGGPTGQKLGELEPINLGSWSNFVDAWVELDAEEVDGIHDLTFIFKGTGSWNLESFSIREATPLKDLGNTAESLAVDNSLGFCEGDCDTNNQCKGNLICYERGGDLTSGLPPGCTGQAHTCGK